MTDNKDSNPSPEIIEGKTAEVEKNINLEQPTTIAPEKKEVLKSDERISAELRRELELMELDEVAKKDVSAKAQKIEFLGEQEKIEHLLQIAHDKGLVFAIQVARKMNEPYLLDVLHDTLAQEGFFKDFSK